MNSNTLQEIIAGWSNYIWIDKTVELEAKRRIEICITCSKFTTRKFCDICGCYMPAKVRSPKSNCGLRKW